MKSIKSDMLGSLHQDYSEKTTIETGLQRLQSI